MLRVERGLLLATALAAVALAGCPRQPEAAPLSQRTPLAASGEPRPQPESGPAWKQFESADLPYKISYPPDWKPIRKNDLEMIVEETVNELQTNVQVFARPKGEFTLTDVLRLSIRRLNQDGIKFQQEEIKLAGFDAWIITTKEGSNNSTTHAEVFSIIGNQLWSLSLYTDSSVAEKEMPKFKKMINSFLLTQPPSEKQIQSNLITFKSTRFPYQMDYPSSWKLNLEGLDLFRKEGGSNIFWTTVRVDASVSVQPRTTADDFLVQVINSHRNERAGYNIYNRVKTKIDGQDAWLISGITRQFGPNPVYFETVLFAKDGRGWLIDLLADPALMQEESQIFRKMRDSFKLR